MLRARSEGSPKRPNMYHMSKALLEGFLAPFWPTRRHQAGARRDSGCKQVSKLILRLFCHTIRRAHPGQNQVQIAPGAFREASTSIQFPALVRASLDSWFVDFWLPNGVQNGARHRPKISQWRPDGRHFEVIWSPSRCYVGPDGASFSKILRKLESSLEALHRLAS